MLTQFQPWTARDIVSVAKLITAVGSFDLADIDRTVARQPYRLAGEQLGFEGTALSF